MKKIIFIALTLVMGLASCQSSKVNISGRFVGSQADMVYLEQTTALEQILLDSVKIDENGRFKLQIGNVAETPSLYNIIFDNERIPLLLMGGDNIELNAAGKVARNYTVIGSLESELLQQFNQSFIDGAVKLNGIIAKFSDGLSDEQRKEITKEYSKLYLDIKKQQLHFIIENKNRIAAVYALHQRLLNEAYLFNGDSDVIYYRTVADAIAETYPESHYLPILRSQIARMDAQISLLSQVKETTIPEISLPDMFGNKRSLSSNIGKVVLLQFWSAALGNSNTLNADLKELYTKYREQGFEIFQVSIDTSKAVWINAIQEQKIPWITVSDLRGESSPALGVYNVQKLPSNYLINREGHIAGKDLTGESLEAEIKKLL
ncbi:MAG: AhpC/TSA family protein [Alistipes sp.]|nr:AhpC/TSA family protein [Alistipes sp.]